MMTKTVKISEKTVARVNPIAFLVQEASHFESKIYITCENKKVNAKSIMGMMTLGLHVEEEVIVSAEGADEQEAIEKIAAYLAGMAE